MKRYSWLFLICSLFLAVSCKKSNGTGDKNGGEPVEVIYKPNATVYGSNKYVEFIVGDLNSPLILASPHDGTIKPASMPFRDNAAAVTVRDIYVTDLTLQIANAFYKKNRHPSAYRYQ